MNLKFWQKSAKPAEAKSIQNVQRAFSGLFAGGLYASTNYSRVSASQALQFYRTVNPVANAVDRVSSGVGSLSPVIWDDEEYKDEAAFPVFLKQPNSIQTWSDFAKDSLQQLISTGDAYLLATGNVMREPKEIIVIPSDSVTPSAYGDILNPDFYLVNIQGRQYEFRKKIVGRQTVYVSGDGLGQMQLAHIKEPHSNASNPYNGMSRLNPIYREIIQHIEANDSNLANMRNGVRPSGALDMPQFPSEEQRAQLQAEIQNFYSGVQNSSRVLITGGGMTFAPFNVTNTDMQFSELRTNLIIDIYTRLDIPLALVVAEQMTLANLQAANLQLYDNAILPYAEKLLSSLALHFGFRFGLEPKQSLTYDPNEITALRSRQYEQVLMLSKIPALTTNELRNELGYVAAGPEADRIYQPSTLVPIASDLETEDEEEPVEKPVEMTDQEKRFFKALGGNYGR